MLKLLYIGNEFYYKSRTIMSSVYTLNGKRSDWGKIQIALEEGEEVHIRPATPNELRHYEKKLAESNIQLKEIEEG